MRKDATKLLFVILILAFIYLVQIHLSQLFVEILKALPPGNFLRTICILAILAVFALMVVKADGIVRLIVELLNRRLGAKQKSI